MATIDQLKGMVSAKLGFARTNNYLVELPPLSSGGGLSGLLGFVKPFIPSIPGITGGGPASTEELNLLCKNVTLPGKQIFTSQRQIGNVNEKMAYGYAVDDLQMSFYLLNDYGAKTYFDQWMEQAYNSKTHEPGYKVNYAKPVTIHQLRKPLLGLSGGLGPIRINVGIGGGNVYSVKLIDAFPTTITQIDFSNEQDGLIEVSVQLSYTDWQVVKPSQQFLSFSLSPGQIFG